MIFSTKMYGMPKKQYDIPSLRSARLSFFFYTVYTRVYPQFPYNVEFLSKFILHYCSMLHLLHVPDQHPVDFLGFTVKGSLNPKL